MAKMTSHNESVSDLIESIDRKFSSNRNSFEPYIEYIRFPRYKNFEKGTKITFGFPLTVFIGQNGSGKSSALHALYGAPMRKSTGNFWFSTKVDPIDDNKEDPHCHIHGYRKNGKIVEALKTRIMSSKHGPDYWEPSRPIERYGMQLLEGAARHPAITKDVVYLDFRAELSAFDKYFYFGSFVKSKTLTNKQAVIRKWSKFIKEAIDEKKILTSRNRKNKKPSILTKNEIEDIAKILGKSYSDCTILDHNYYDSNSGYGSTAYFCTNELRYSEAFAGRGEFAVVKLVHEIHGTPDHSLVILDEPEVSLHPGAQEELKRFLLKMIKIKNLQVVISTHSRVFAEHLPDSAIKLFYEADNSFFSIQDSCHYLEAFRNIGVRRKKTDKAIIVVEDITAKILLEAMLEKLQSGFPDIFRIEYYPGGAESLLKCAVHYSEEQEKHKFIILDGDKKKKIFQHSEIMAQSDNITGLANIIREITGISYNSLKPFFRLDGGNDLSGHNSQKNNAAKNYILFLQNHLQFLPKLIPEEIIWDDEYVKELLKDKYGCITRQSTLKGKIHEFANALIGPIENATHSATAILARHFLDQKTDSQEYIEIRRILNSYKEMMKNS